MYVRLYLITNVSEPSNSYYYVWLNLYQFREWEKYNKNSTEIY